MGGFTNAKKNPEENKKEGFSNAKKNPGENKKGFPNKRAEQKRIKNELPSLIERMVIEAAEIQLEKNRKAAEVNEAIIKEKNKRNPPKQKKPKKETVEIDVAESYKELMLSMSLESRIYTTRKPKVALID